MKRIIGMAAALAVLGYSTFASAVPVTFDVSGTATVNTVSANAANPSLPAGSTGLDPIFGPYFIGATSAGSSMSVDITGTNVTLTGGSLIFHLNTPIGAIGSVQSDVVATPTGGVGTLSGDQILWDMSGAPGTGTFWNVTGTWTCHGAGLCGIIGIPDGTTLPIATLQAVTGTLTVAPTLMGIWQLDPTHTSILGSTWNTIQVGGPDSTDPLAPGQVAQWYTFGSSDLGHLPEPGTFALMLLGISGLALRARKA
jgi:hypothetical protein